MSLPKLTFEVWPEFPLISERLAIRDFSRLNCQRVTCTPVQCLFCNEYGAPIAPPCGQAMLESRLLWIREFESSHPSQPVRSLLFDFGCGCTSLESRNAEIRCCEVTSTRQPMSCYTRVAKWSTPACSGREAKSLRLARPARNFATCMFSRDSVRRKTSLTKSSKSQTTAREGSHPHAGSN
jgi:hypothetical protein